MSTYVIGDIQGCYDELRHLLDRIQFDPENDRLWFAGDLVNRGPHSLKTLRFVKSLGQAAICVLGNHDLHLIALTLKKNKPHKHDSLQPILQAPDCDELIDWLRHRKLFYQQDRFCLVHAGVPPQWDITQCHQRAREVERLLQSPDYADFIAVMYGNTPNDWREDSPAMERARFIVNCFTRMRYCDKEGRLDFHHKGAPGTQADGLVPWFSLPQRKTRAHILIFGHWSTLGFYHGHNCYGIDTGCLWGGQLTALKLGSIPERLSIDCHPKLSHDG